MALPKHKTQTKHNKYEFTLLLVYLYYGNNMSTFACQESRAHQNFYLPQCSMRCTETSGFFPTCFCKLFANPLIFLFSHPGSETDFTLLSEYLQVLHVFTSKPALHLHKPFIEGMVCRSLVCVQVLKQDYCKFLLVFLHNLCELRVYMRNLNFS